MDIILTVCILKKKLNINCILRVVINGYLANTLVHFFKANWMYSFLEAMCNNNKKIEIQALVSKLVFMFVFNSYFLFSPSPVLK